MTQNTIFYFCKFARFKFCEIWEPQNREIPVSRKFYVMKVFKKIQPPSCNSSHTVCAFVVHLYRFYLFSKKEHYTSAQGFGIEHDYKYHTAFRGVLRHHA